MLVFTFLHTVSFIHITSRNSILFRCCFISFDWIWTFWSFLQIHWVLSSGRGCSLGCSLVFTDFNSRQHSNTDRNHAEYFVQFYHLLKCFNLFGAVAATLMNHKSGSVPPSSRCHPRRSSNNSCGRKRRGGVPTQSLTDRLGGKRASPAASLPLIHLYLSINRSLIFNRIPSSLLGTSFSTRLQSRAGARHASAWCEANI